MAVSENFRKRDELLAGVANDLLRFGDPERLLRSVFERISRYTNIDVCWCYFLRAERLELAFSRGVGREELLQNGLAAIAKCEKDAVKYERILSSHDSGCSSLRGLGVDAYCCHPLLAGEKVVGTLSFGSRRQSSFESEEWEAQRAVADQVAIAFDRLVLLEELARNNQKLLAAHTELKRVHAELEQIAVAASHDLREPTRHLSIYAELLERELQPALNKQAAQYLQFVLSNARRVELLVSDLLEYTGVSWETPAAKEIDASIVAAEVCRKRQGLIQSTGAEINVRELPRLEIAEEDLALLFENLIENAIVHHRPGRTPNIQIYSYWRDQAPVICVRDNGGGIEPQYLETIFGLFKRLSPPEPGAGRGLGLTLCRKIVERYGGQIWVESEPGLGTAFCFTLKRTGSPKALAARSGDMN